MAASSCSLVVGFLHCKSPTYAEYRWFSVLYKHGGPGEIRTHDLCLRRAALYPAELRVRDGPDHTGEARSAQRERFPAHRVPSSPFQARCWPSFQVEGIMGASTNHRINGGP